MLYSWHLDQIWKRDWISQHSLKAQSNGPFFRSDLRDSVVISWCTLLVWESVRTCIFIDNIKYLEDRLSGREVARQLSSLRFSGSQDDIYAATDLIVADLALLGVIITELLEIPDQCASLPTSSWHSCTQGEKHCLIIPSPIHTLSVVSSVGWERHQ